MSFPAGAGLHQHPEPQETNFDDEQVHAPGATGGRVAPTGSPEALAASGFGPMTAPGQRVVTLTIAAPLVRSDLPGLLARTCALLASGPIESLHCEVAEIAPDAVAVDALARLALAARRRGCHVRLSGASEELAALVTFMGLADVLRI